MSITGSDIIRNEAGIFAERTGIRLPDVLLRLYGRIGNGGFGPEYGFLGIVTGHQTDIGDSILTLYLAFSSSDPDDPHWDWPKMLVPIIHVGCGIHYCIHADSGEIYLFDPNGHSPECPKDPGEMFKLQPFDIGQLAGID